jgi:hypothetical protein
MFAHVRFSFAVRVLIDAASARYSATDFRRVYLSKMSSERRETFGGQPAAFRVAGCSILQIISAKLIHQGAGNSIPGAQKFPSISLGWAVVLITVLLGGPQFYELSSRQGPWCCEHRLCLDRLLDGNPYVCSRLGSLRRRISVSPKNSGRVCPNDTASTTERP